MRDYAKVSPQFWTGRTGRALKAAGPEAVIVGLYLMTSPHANMIGVYYCPVEYIALDTGLGLEGASKGLASAIKADFCTFEADSGYVFVHEFAAYQIGDELDPKDLRCKGVKNELSKVPKGQCWQSFRARYAVPFNLPIETQKDKLPASPLQDPPKPGAGAGAGKEVIQREPTVLVASPADAAEDDAPAAPGLPSCPTAELVSAYAKALPALPQVGVLNDSRKRAASARWREVCAAEKFDKPQGVEWFADFFVHVSRSPFLCGQGPPDKRTGRVWRADFDWLMNPTNFAKVVDGRYHEHEATT